MISRDYVTRQYASEAGLEVRQSVWQPTLDGRDPATEALALIVEAEPARVLEVGCGTGGFAARIAAAMPDTRLVATDQSPRMVELAETRGIDARTADVSELPFADAKFDAVAALWMLYHVPDVDRALAEIRRVLRPGGLLVAVTNGNEHTADLRREAGGVALVTGFSSELGGELLARHFARVSREDFTTRAVFPDHASAAAYLASLDDDFPWDLPVFDGPREYAGHVTVFAAR